MQVAGGPCHSSLRLVIPRSRSFRSASATRGVPLPLLVAFGDSTPRVRWRGRRRVLTPGEGRRDTLAEAFRRSDNGEGLRASSREGARTSRGDSALALPPSTQPPPLPPEGIPLWRLRENRPEQWKNKQVGYLNCALALARKVGYSISIRNRYPWGSPATARCVWSFRDREASPREAE